MFATLATREVLMDLIHDVRLSVRNLIKAPGYTAAALLTLALAMGASSAIFSAVRVVLLDPLPIRQPGDLVICWETSAGYGVAELSYRHFQEWAAHSRSFMALRQLDLGFSPDGVLAVNVSARDPDAGNPWVDELLRRVNKLPGVESAGAVYLRPLALGPIGQGTWVIREGQPDTTQAAMENPTLNYQSATPGYFSAMRIALKRGRLFNAQDTDRAPRVAIVGESTARRLWPNEDPIGRRILMPTFEPGDKTNAWRTVVGVVSDVRYRGLDQVQLDVYDAALQSAMVADDLVVRASGDLLAMIGAIQAEVRRSSPRAVVDGVTTMDGIVAREAAPWTFSVWMFTAFALLAFVLATVGLFSVVSLDVAQRSREFAVRLALGARQRDIFRRVLVSAAGRVGVGLTLGVLVALAATRWMRSLLFGIDPLDGSTYVGVIGLVILVVAIASSLPARRASGLDPMVLLKRE